MKTLISCWLRCIAIAPAVDFAGKELTLQCSSRNSCATLKSILMIRVDVSHLFEWRAHFFASSKEHRRFSSQKLESYSLAFLGRFFSCGPRPQWRRKCKPAQASDRDLLRLGSLELSLVELTNAVSKLAAKKGSRRNAFFVVRGKRRKNRERLSRLQNPFCEFEAQPRTKNSSRCENIKTRLVKERRVGARLGGLHDNNIL